MLGTRSWEEGTGWALAGGGCHPGLTIHAPVRGLCKGSRGGLLQLRVQELGVWQGALRPWVSSAELDQALPQLSTHLSHCCHPKQTSWSRTGRPSPKAPTTWHPCPRPLQASTHYYACTQPHLMPAPLQR